MKSIFKIFAMVFSLLYVGTSFAGGYFGGSFGSTSPNEEGFKDDSGFKITGGYKVSDAVAFEISYTDLGAFDAENDIVDAVEYLSGVPIDSVSIEITGMEFAVVGFAPISDTVSFFAKAGIYSWDADLVIKSTNYGSITESDDGSDPFIGAGIYIDLNDKMALKGEFIRYDAFEGDVDFLGAGLDVKF